MKAIHKYGVLALLTAVIAQVYGWRISLAMSFIVWMVLGGYYTLYLMYHTLYRDLKTIWRLGHLVYLTTSARRADLSVGDKFQITANRCPDRIMITCCHDSGSVKMTYREVQEMSWKVAAYFSSKGYKKGDVVALFMETRAEYVCYWLGLSYLGVIPALINSHVRQQGLLHSLKIVNTKAVIFSSDLQLVMADIRDQLSDMELFYVDDCNLKNSINLTECISSMSSSTISTKYVGYNDRLFYIYTSGTTGLPKAAIIKHSRFMFAAYALYCLCHCRENDVVYSPLPLYHTAGGVVSVGTAILEGVPLVTRKKFSARMFWNDCISEGVTVTQYIGEIARYVYAAKENKNERQHKVRMMFGNGMRVDLWEKYIKRFGVKEICEFYGSTEGNCSVGNITGQVGSAGAISVLFPWLIPLALVKVKDREPLRDKGGLCVPCKVGEAGELVGRIDKGHPVRDFHGYADKSATNKKIMYDVFTKGDKCFRSGDIFTMDKFGNLYFKDRAGDTFRWKGENVSTMEVEVVVSEALGLKDCVVYGVEVPGNEGRAGMIAVPAAEGDVDMAKLYTRITQTLPVYARPLFIRLVEKIEFTATYKMKKRDLQWEGINPNEISDPLFVLDAKTWEYIPLKADLYQEVVSGTFRL